MSIPFKYKINRIQKSIRLQNSLIGNDKEWIAWWYGGIYKNNMAKSQPHVLVAFRVLFDNHVGDYIIKRKVPLTTLGQVRLGTVWKDSTCQGKAILNVASFTVNFSKEGWQYLDPSYLQDIYPHDPENKGELLEFSLPTGGKLVIPCIEFFSRCYGRSQELKRILATYPWHGNYEAHSRLYAPVDTYEESGKWKIKLTDRLVRGDTVFLAHAKYDSYTQWQAKSIYAKIEAHNKKTPAFIQIAPWFLGPARIQVEGIWFNNRKSFLGLRITGCSDPDGVPIIREHDIANKDKIVGEHGENGRKSFSAILSKYPEIVDLTSYSEPGNGNATIEVEDDDFVTLGEPRIVFDEKGNRTGSKSGHRNFIIDAYEFSSGENYGSDKSVSYASIFSKQTVDSKGILHDMWDAMLFLKKKYPEQIQAVDYFTFEDGFATTPSPKLIALQPFGENAQVNGEIRNWVYLDKSIKKVRGILVARLKVNLKTVYILEIQRRFYKFEGMDSEESIMGMVFLLDDQEKLGTWLKEVMSKIRYTQGVLQKVTATCPGKAYAFKHVQAKDESVPCEAAVLNALRKVGIEIKR